MIKRLTAIATISLFAWSAVFGDVEGLLLCIHKDLKIHPEWVNETATDCAAYGFDTTPELNNCSDRKACIDVPLKAADLPLVLISKTASDDTIDAHCSVSNGSTETGHNFTLEAIANFVDPHAPPELVDTSVLIAQTIILRI